MNLLYYWKRFLQKSKCSLLWSSQRLIIDQILTRKSQEISINDDFLVKKMLKKCSFSDAHFLPFQRLIVPRLLSLESLNLLLSGYIPYIHTMVQPLVHKLGPKNIISFWFLDHWKLEKQPNRYSNVNEVVTNMFPNHHGFSSMYQMIKMLDSIIPASRTPQLLEMSQPNSVWLTGIRSSKTTTLASYQGLSINSIRKICNFFLSKSRIWD